MNGERRDVKSVSGKNGIGASKLLAETSSGDLRVTFQ